MYCRTTVTIPPQEVVLIPLNVAIEIPPSYFVLLAGRSSTHKLGITCANGIGIGDYDFIGDNDEYHFPALNFTTKPVTIERGSRICQIIILPVEKVIVKEVEKLSSPDRGAFGTTGK